MQLNPRPITLPKHLSSKTVLVQNNPNLKSQIKEYFLNTYSVYEKLFELLADQRAYYIRAQPLRHPLIFYFGHTACLYVNKFLDHGMIKQRINEKYEKMFAVGVDEMDWDDLNQSHYDWPTVQQTREYRNQVKQMVIQVIDSETSNKINSWLDNLWVVLLGIEHERIHLETSAVIMRRVPLNFIKRVEQFIQCEYKQNDIAKIPNNSYVDLPAWKATWQRKKENAQNYGWDNQFGVKQFNVEQFQASQMLVSNGEFLAFVQDGGYGNPEWWSDEGKRWIASIKPSMPVFWNKVENGYRLRVLARMIDMPWDWPAQVNNLQARAFCRWKSSKSGCYIRLPTEDEYYSIRSKLDKDHTNWQYQQVGNINMEYWMSPNPVNLFKTGQFYDVVGNVWQHTITPIYPLNGFQIHPVYEDFTTPTFDERHDIIKGGSFISTGNQTLYHSRYAFRRHFYQFAGFRYIKTERHLDVDLHSQEISDVNVQMNLKHHYQNNKSYVFELAKVIADKVGSKAKDSKVLTVGCSVGRVPLELSKVFKESIGVDYTTRYFQMSTRLKEKGVLKFKDIDISLEQLGIDAAKVELFQMNPQNPDQKKINQCDWIIVDGFSVKKNTLPSILKKISKIGKRTVNIAILNVSDYNSVSKEQGKQILSKAVNGEVVVGQEYVLKASEEDQGYLPQWSKQVEFRVNYYEVIEP